MTDKQEIEFVKGLIVKPPRDGAPDFVKASLSIKIEELLDWLGDREGDWVNIDVKEAKSGKWYAAVNTWKPDGKREDAPKGGGRGNPAPADDDFPDDDLPF